ncbi:MAG: type II toxin-antitoxin system mRNA interferase toxin, RelE/StbE family [Candidatus Gracilibacteria bacterium]|nr:type II toxin-antitoxin system mRNA interferase toxin, RelE/StbE family [Candidatus Gracilibacteria bacterium]
MKKDGALEKKIDKCLMFLAQDPSYPSLQSHKVESQLYGEKWASRVSGDLRIIWDYDQENIPVLNILDLGSHSGKKKIYK